LGKGTVSSKYGLHDGLTASGFQRVLHRQLAEISLATERTIPLATERTIPLEIGCTGRMSPGNKCNTQESAVWAVSFE